MNMLLNPPHNNSVMDSETKKLIDELLEELSE